MLMLTAAREIRPGVVVLTTLAIDADVLPEDGTDRLLADLAGDGWQAEPAAAS